MTEKMEKMEKNMLAMQTELFQHLERINNKADLIIEMVGGKRKTEIKQQVKRQPARSKSVPGQRKPIAINLWFEHKFTNEEFRARIINKELEEEIKINKIIQGEVNDIGKNKKICSYVWNYIRNRNKELLKKLEEERDAERNAELEESNKQQAIEPNTDDETEEVVAPPQAVIQSQKTSAIEDIKVDGIPIQDGIPIHDVKDGGIPIQDIKDDVKDDIKEDGKNDVKGDDKEDNKEDEKEDGKDDKDDKEEDDKEKVKVKRVVSGRGRGRGGIRGQVRGRGVPRPARLSKA